jgi:hypothetical protein
MMRSLPALRAQDTSGRVRARRAFLAISGVLLSTAGCSPFNPRPDPTVFLVLTTMSASTPTSAPALAGMSIGVGPVTLPAYLQRPQLVARVDATEVRVHEYARWSAPLTTLFAEAVAEQLMSQLSPRSVVVYPWPTAERPAVSVRIAVQQFEPMVPDSAILRARWEVVDRSGNPMAAPRVSEHRTEAPADPNDAPIALSRLVGMLSSEIAAALRTGR